MASNAVELDQEKLVPAVCVPVDAPSAVMTIGVAALVRERTVPDRDAVLEPQVETKLCALREAVCRPLWVPRIVIQRVE